MTKAKKVLSLVLAVVMVATLFAFSANAASNQHATFTVTSSANTAQIGDEITVTVNLAADYFVGPTMVPVYYNPAVFEFVPNSVSGVRLFGVGATDVQSHNDAVAGCVRVAFIPQSAKGAEATQFPDAFLFSFKLKAIANGDSDIKIDLADQKTSSNTAGTLYCGAFETSSVLSKVDMFDQTMVANNTTVKVGAVAATLVGKTGTVNGETSTGIVDEARSYIYGIVPGGDLADFFEMSDGTPLVTALGTASAANGTGATVTVGDKVYTLIVFGDVDGDGALSGTDAINIEQYVGGTLEKLPNDVAKFASDVDNDTIPSGTDAINIEQYVGGTHSKVPQSR